MAKGVKVGDVIHLVNGKQARVWLVLCLRLCVCA